MDSPLRTVSFRRKIPILNEPRRAESGGVGELPQKEVTELNQKNEESSGGDIMIDFASLKKLKDGKFVHLNEYCILGKPPEWGIEEKEGRFVYVIAVRTWEGSGESGYHVCAMSSSWEETMLQAVNILSLAANQGVAFEFLKEATLMDVLQKIKEEDGEVASWESQWKVKASPEDAAQKMSEFHNISLYIEGDKCFGVSQ